MKAIKLRGRFATGADAIALVDDGDYDRLSRYAWKAKPSASGLVYAVRNNGPRTVRMHREVLGLGAWAGLDVDHINRNTLDNRRENLRAVSRGENLRNMRPCRVVRVCSTCARADVLDVPGGGRPIRSYVCRDCRAAALKAARPDVRRGCAWCGAAFVVKTYHHRYCCDAHRYAAKYRRRHA